MTKPLGERYYRENKMLSTSNLFEKNRQVNFKTNSEYLSRASEVFAQRGLDVTAAINAFIYEVANTQELPFQTLQEKERDKRIAQLGAEIDKNLLQLRAGKGMTIDEAEDKLFG